MQAGGRIARGGRHCAIIATASTSATIAGTIGKASCPNGTAKGGASHSALAGAKDSKGRSFAAEANSATVKAGATIARS